MNDHIIIIVIMRPQWRVLEEHHCCGAQGLGSLPYRGYESQFLL